MLRHRFVLVVALLGAVLFAAGCAGGGEKDTAENEGITAEGEGDEQASYGVIVLTSGHPFYQAYAQHWRDLAEQEGFRVTVLDAELKVEKQQQAFEDLRTRGVDAIAVSPVDPASVVPPIQEAIGAGIEVITIAVETAAAPVVVEGAYDAGFQGGVEAGKWIQRNHPDWKVNVGIVDFPVFQQTVNRANGFIAGLQSIIKDAKVVARQNGDAVLDKSTRVAEDMLEAHPDANVWFGINDDSALGALNALKAAGKGTSDKALVVGFDGSAPALKELLDPNSALKVEVGNLPLSYVKTARRVLDELRAGEDVPHVTLVPATVLTDKTPRDEVVRYYESEYGGKFDE